MSKEWSTEQREAARKLIAEKRGTPKSWPFETDEVVDLQCELTEAVELLQVATHTFDFGMLGKRLDWVEKRREFLKRNASPAPPKEEA